MNSHASEKKPRILLVVEDLAQMEYLVNIMFHHGAYQVFPVQSVDDARSSLEKEAPDLVVTDMPTASDVEEKLARFMDNEPELARVKILALAHLADSSTPPRDTGPHERIIRVSEDEYLPDKIGELLPETRDSSGERQESNRSSKE